MSRCRGWPSGSVPVMATLPAQESVDLRAVTVRPTWGAQEHRRWDRLVAEHHYLPFHGVIGKGLRHVAVHGETWLALIGWQPGAFKLAARDRWIGWPAEQQFRRLHLANNSRFVILTPGRVHNLASRVLGLSRTLHGVFLAETLTALCRDLLARRTARSPEARRAGARPPKEIRVRNCDAGRNAEQHTDQWRRRGCAACSSVWARCPSAAVTGASATRNTVLAIAVAARLAGYRGVNAFARRPALPGAARGSGCVLEPEAALHRARNHHLPQHPRRAAARDPGQRHRSVDRQHGTCACRHGREGPAPRSSRSGRWRSTPGRASSAASPRSCHRQCDARPVRDGALTVGAVDYVAPSRTIRKPSSKTSRRSTSPGRNRRQGPWPHRAPPLCRRRPLRRRMGRLREPPRAPPGDAHRTRARS